MGTLRQTVIAAFGSAVMMIAAIGGAHAQSISLVAGNSFVDNGWTVSITSFTCTVSQFGSQTSCASSGISLANDVLEVVNTGRNVSFALANTTAGQPVVQFTNSYVGSPSIYNNERVDITYSLQVLKTSSNAQNLNSLSLAVLGTISGDSTPYLYSIPTGGITDDGASLGYVGANGTSGSITPITFNSATGVAGPVTFTPSTQLTITQDLALVATPGSTLTFTQNPTNAPEPATLAILVPAVLAMAKARKSRKRQR